MTSCVRGLCLSLPGNYGPTVRLRCHSAFSNWKRGNGRLYYAYIDKIADRLGVSIDYLVRGFDIEQDSLSAREVELITSFRKMSERCQKVILENAELLAGS